MKKLIIICFLIAISFTVNAQTEEETISWLKEKLTNNIVGYTNYQITITRCELIISTDKWQAKIPTDVEPEFNTSTNSSGQIHDGISTKAARIAYKNSDGVRYWAGFYGQFELTESETDLRARINKALKHLATFCPKKKETF